VPGLLPRRCLIGPYPASCDELLQELKQTPALAKRLGSLKVEGGTVPRQAYVAIFPELVRALRFSQYLSAGTAEFARALARGDACVEKQQLAEALKAYNAMATAQGRDNLLKNVPEVWRKAAELTNKAGIVKVADADALYTNQYINDAFK